MPITAATAALVRGARRLTLTAGRYSLGRDFRPPDVELEPQIALGTSANRSGGGVKVGERAGDRTWEFSVYLQNCASIREVEQAARDLRDFLLAAGDEAEPLYLEYRASSAIASAPLWGQGVLRYEIIHGRFQLGDLYALTTLRGRNVPACPVTVRVKPYAVGLAQRLGSAMGGVVMDTYGTLDGQARGVAVCQAASSVFTNPIFGHSTWNNGWSTGASLTAASNTDPNFLLPDSRVSAHLTSRGGGVTNQYSQGLTFTTGSPYIITALVKLPDSSSPTNSDLTLHRGTTGCNASFFAVGNGIWEASGSVAGNGAACDTGIKVGVGRSLYLLGMQTSASYRQPFMHGDQLGSSWDGTAHSSATTRAVGRVRWPIDDVMRRGQGTMRVIYKYHTGGSPVANQRLLTVDNTGSFAIVLQNASTLVFQDGTNGVTAGFTTPTAGQIDVVHVTFGPAGIFLYRNGAWAASGATYSPPHDGTHLYLGTSGGATAHGNGTFLDFTTWPTQATEAEIAADYADVQPLVSAGGKVSDVPWLWTKDGDDVVDNVNDTALDNWAAAGGIPGSGDAATSYELSVSAQNRGAYWLFNQRSSYNRFPDPSSHLYSDLSGSTDGDASGSAYAGRAAGTSSSLTAQDVTYPETLSGEYAFFVRAKGEAAASILFTPAFTYANAKTFFAPRTITPSASYANFLIATGTVDEFVDLPATRKTISVSMSACVTGGSLGWDSFFIMPHPLLRVMPNASSGGYLITGNRAIGLKTTKNIHSWATTIGQPVELRPNAYNVLLTMSGSNGAPANKADTITFDAVTVTPRYGLV